MSSSCWRFLLAGRYVSLGFLGRSPAAAGPVRFRFLAEPGRVKKEDIVVVVVDGWWAGGMTAKQIFFLNCELLALVGRVSGLWLGGPGNRPGNGAG